MEYFTLKKKEVTQCADSLASTVKRKTKENRNSTQ